MRTDARRSLAALVFLFLWVIVPPCQAAGS